MIGEKQDGELGDVSPKEAAHLRHRDKKRRTEMVVDGAGVKRIAPVLHSRKTTPHQPEQSQ